GDGYRQRLLCTTECVIRPQGIGRALRRPHLETALNRVHHLSDWVQVGPENPQGFGATHSPGQCDQLSGVDARRSGSELDYLGRTQYQQADGTRGFASCIAGDQLDFTVLQALHEGTANRG